MSNVNLTYEQQQAILSIVQGIRRDGKVIQTLGGYAGTGKTTIISYLVDILPNYSVCAFTGKAANVLRRKGVPASTIHSLIYRPEKDSLGNVTFELKQRDELQCDGFIVDEASMVSEDIYRDISSFGLPLIFVGDHGQLEPVGSDFNLMRNPDYRLETIHRNAGEISRFAEWLRKGNKASRFPTSNDQIEFINKWEIEERDLYSSVDQIICAYNRTRVSTNMIIRERLNRSDRLLVQGEKIMCLRNNRKRCIFNGMQGTVIEYRKHRYQNIIDFDSYGEYFEGIPINPSQFNQEKTLPCDSQDDPSPFDYAYCITAHKSQGDEFNTIMIYEQYCKRWDHKRWTYTAASRSKEKIYWVSGM